MKNLRISSLWRYVIASVLVSTCLILSSPISFGESTSSKTPAQGTDCRFAPNPDECYRKQSQQQWRPYDPTSAIPSSLNTRNLGLDGPFGAELKYDAELSWILGLNYLHMFGESAGIATKLTGGPNEFRGNLTAGIAFNKDHQLKLTYEYLTQNLPFDFASGTINEWVAQHSLGAAYQYVIRHQILHSLEISGYATRAGSKELDPITFNQQALDSSAGYLYDVNYRRIAGGRENTVLASVNLFPFATPTTTLTVGAGYSNVGYDTIYESDQAASRPAYKAELTHLLSPKAKVIAGTTATASSTEHSVGVSHLLPKKFELSVKGQYTAGQGTLKDNKSVTLGISYPAAEGYSLTGFSEVQQLKDWLDKPIVYATRVLAIKDELVQRYAFQAANTLDNQEKYPTQLLTEVTTASAFTFSDPQLQVSYSVAVFKLSEQAAKTSKLAKSAAPASGKDYTKDLNLGLFATTTPNQAVLKSATDAGIPAEDSEGHSTAGVYNVVLTATTTAPGGTPLTATNSFQLTVHASGPDWDTTDLPNALIGFVYPPDAKNGEVEITSKAHFYTPDTSISVAVEGGDIPSWLSLVNCSFDTTRQCLSSSVIVPKDKKVANFTVTLTATAHPSEKTATNTFKIPVVEAKPIWNLPETIPEVELNAPQPIHLVDYVTNTYGIEFEKGSSSEADHWIVASNGDLTINTENPPTLGLKSIPVKARNQTSFEDVSQDVAVTVVDSSLVPAWTTQTQLSPIKADTPSTQDLSTLGLVQTPGATGDTYDFTIVGTPTKGTWKILPNSSGIKNILSLTDAGGLPLATDTVKIQLMAYSHDAGKNAINGNISAEVQEVTVKLIPNDALTVRWNAATLPSGQAGEAYSQDLNTLAGSAALVKTTNGTSSVQDHYDFTLVAQGTDPGWELNNNVLSNPTPAANPAAHVVLTAKSEESGNPATGGNVSDTEQQISIVINKNPELTTSWTNAILTDAPIGDKYDHDLAGMGLLQTLNEESLPVSDTYQITLTNDHGNANWKVNNNHLQYVDPTTGSLIPVPYPTAEVKLTLHAVSVEAGAKSPIDKEFTLRFSKNPKLIVSWVKDTLPVATAGTIYQAQLNLLNLLQTKTSDGVTISDFYTFSIANDHGNTHWKILGTGDMLQYVDDSGDVTPVAYTANPVVLTLHAVSNASGNAPTDRDFTITIQQNKNLTVSWTSVTLPDATAGINYDHDLTSLGLLQTWDPTIPRPITNDSYTITLANDHGNKNWQIDNNHLQYVDPTTSELLPVTYVATPVSLTLHGESADAGPTRAPADKDFTVTIKQNTDLTVSWTTNTITAATAGETYSKDLDTMSLLQTMNGSTPIGTDTYTITLANDHGNTNWKIDANNRLKYVDADGNLIPVAYTETPVELTLHAVSADAGPSKSPADKDFTLVINQDPTLTVSWVDGKTLPVAITGDQYDKDLTSLGLLQTFKGTTKITNDNYLITLTNDHGNTNWKMNNNHLQYVDPTSGALIPVAFAPAATLTLHGVSLDAGPAASPADKDFTVTIEQQPSLNVKWTTDGKLTDALAGTTYDLDLAALDPELLITTNSSGQEVADSYTLSITNDHSNTHWKINNNHLQYVDPISGALVPVIYSATPVMLTLHAVSADTGLPPSSGDKDFTVTIKQNTALTVSWTNVTLPDATAGINYDNDLISLGLLQTFNGSTPITNDSYTVTVANDHGNTNWKINNNHLQYVDPVTSELLPVVYSATPVNLTLHGESADAGPTRAPTDKDFTVTIKQNTDLSVSWTNNTIAAATAGSTYRKDLDTMSLLQTLNGTTPVTTDTYTITLVNDHGNTNWKVNANNQLEYVDADGNLIPVVYTATPIVLTLHGVSNDAGPSKSPADKDFTLALNQDPTLTVSWVNGKTLPDALAGVNYDKDLTGLGLLQTYKGTTPVTNDVYTITLANDHGNTNWRISNNHLQYVDPTSGDLVSVKYTATAPTLTLHGVSADAGPTASPADKDFTVTISQNTNLTVSWNTVTLPNAKAQTAYDRDLLALNLLTTLNGSTPVTNDSYTITLANNHGNTNWEINGNHLQYVDPTTHALIPVNYATPVLLTFHGESADAGPTRAPGDKDFTVTIDTNPDLDVAWISNKFPVDASAGATYTADLNALNLVQSKNASGVFTETYQFELQGASQGTWTLENNKLTGKNIILPKDSTSTDLTVTLRAKSPNKGGYANSMTSTPSDPDQPVTLHVVANASLNPLWVKNTLPNATGGATEYTVDLNQLVGDNKLVKTENPSDDDTCYQDGNTCYDFYFKGASQGQWPAEGFLPAGEGGRLGLLKGTGLTGGTVTLTLSAYSRNAHKDALNMDPHPEPVNNQIVTFTIPVVPVIDPTRTTTAMKFDTVVKAGKLTYTAVNLSAMISNADAFVDNTTDFIFNDTQSTTSGNWEIFKDTTQTPNVFYLARKLNTTYQSIDSSEVAQTVAVPPMKVSAKVKTSGEVVSTVTGSSAVKIKLDVDPDLIYFYKDAAGTAKILTAATSDGIGGMNPKIAANAGFPIEAPVKICTPGSTSTTNCTQICTKADCTAQEAVKYTATSGDSPYVSVVTIDKVDNVAFKAPSPEEYVKLATLGSYDQYLQASSPANGNIPKAGNIINMTPLKAGSLLLVPTKTGSPNVNLAFTSNKGPNVGIGITGLGQTYTVQCSHITATSLVVKLPDPPNGKVYKLTRLPIVGTSAIPACVQYASRVCPGIVYPKNVPTGPVDYPGGGSGATTYDAESSIYSCPNGSDIDAGSLPTNPATLKSTTFTIAGGQLGLSDGRVIPGGKNNIPTVYNENMNTNGSGQDTDAKRIATAPKIGSDYVDYTDFPTVILQ